MNLEIEYHHLTKSDLSNDDKTQLAKLLIELEEIEYKLPTFPLEYHIADIDNSPRSHQNEIWILARRNDTIVGFLRSQWNIETSNLDIAFINSLLVLEDYRRSGIGRMLVSTLIKLLPPQITKISYWAMKDSPGQLFMEALFGKKPAQTDLQSVSEIRKFVIGEVSEKVINLTTEAKNKGFRFIYVENADFAKFVDIEEYVKFFEAIHADMPMEELTWEKETFTIQKFLDKYLKNIAKGHTYFSFIALQEDDIAGVTETQVNHLQPFVGDQLMTGVAQRFRGNKLGLTLKYLMLEKLLRDTEVEYWTTTNAGSNKHMLRINRELGYKPWTVGHMYDAYLDSISIKIE